jgi:endonuclease III
MFIYGTFWINIVTCLILFAQHACLVEVLTRMANILEYELKSENKDQLLVAFGKTNPAARKPCMSSCILF